MNKEIKAELEEKLEGSFTGAYRSIYIQGAHNLSDILVGELECCLEDYEQIIKQLKGEQDLASMCVARGGKEQCLKFLALLKPEEDK